MRFPSDVECFRFRFGPFELDTRQGKLYRRGVLVSLENQAFLVLAALVQTPGVLVSREDLCKRLWPDGTNVDFDDGLNTAVRKLRHALHDSATKPLFIETVPRRGYVLVAPVIELSSAPASLPPSNDGQSSQAVPLSPPVAAASPSSSPRRSWFGPAIAVIVAVLCFPVLLRLALRRGEPPKEPQLTRISFGRGLIVSARFMPDGRGAVYGAAWEGKPIHLFWSAPGSPASHALGADADILAISRSNQMALLLRRRLGPGALAKGTLAVMALTESAPRELLDNVVAADWSTDGLELAVIHYVGDVCRLEYPLGKVIYQTTGGAWLSHVRVSPSMEWVAFLEHPVAGDDMGRAVTMSLRTGQKAVTGDFSSIAGLAWEPQSDELMFSATEWAVSGGRAIFRWQPGKVPQLLRRETAQLTLHDISRNGDLLVTRAVLHDEVWGHFNGVKTERSLGWLDVNLPTELSADGTRLLFAIEGEAARDSYKAFVASTVGGEPTFLGDGMPTGFSPDGKTAISIFPWDSHSGSIPQIRLLPTGPGAPREVTADSISHAWATWRPGHEQIIFTGAEPGHQRRSWLQDIQGGKPRALTPEGIFGLRVSPDGETLAAMSESNQVWLYSLASGSARLLVNLPAEEEADRWSGDGKYLFFTRYGLPAEVYRVNAKTGIRKLLYRPSPADPTGVEAVGPVLVTADGKSYVYAYTRTLSTLYILHSPETK